MNLSKNSFNARYMSYEAVAETFIPNKQFEALLSNSHSVLMGPRGCGKTTLLKMLQPVALHNWKGEEAEDLKRRLDFWAVYIPTDNQWNEQLKSFKSELKIGDDDLFQKVSNALVCLNVINALCSTFKDLINISAKDENEAFEKETCLATALIGVWDIPKPITPSFYSLYQYILKQIAAINTWRKEYNLNGVAKCFDDVTAYHSRELIDQVTLGCSAFQYLFEKEPFLNSKKFKWALCFDELEIAPSWLRKTIFSKYVRSKSNQNLLFKLTSAPLMEWDDIFEDANNIPSRDNDYNVIRTWVYDHDTSKEWKVFCERLYGDVLKREFGLDNVDLAEVFGEDDKIKVYEIEENINADNSTEKYNKGSAEWQLFIKLAEKDISFRDYLTKKGIDPTNPIADNVLIKDSVFRKILPIVVWRNALLKDSATRRARKNVCLYFGLPLLYDLSEGNPRAAINLINQFVNSATGEGKMTFSHTMQNKIIADFSSQRLDFFENYPNTTEYMGFDQHLISMGDIISDIGSYFYEDIVGEKFNADIKSSFRVDDKTPEPIIRLIKTAISLGAIQHLNPKKEVTKGGLMGQKFKLAYTLYPVFKLLTRFDHEINVSTIVLNKKTRTSKKDTYSGMSEITFPDEN